MKKTIKVFIRKFTACVCAVMFVAMPLWKNIPTAAAENDLGNVTVALTDPQNAPINFVDLDREKESPRTNTTTSAAITANISGAQQGEPVSCQWDASNPDLVTLKNADTPSVTVTPVEKKHGKTNLRVTFTSNGRELASKSIPVTVWATPQLKVTVKNSNASSPGVYQCGDTLTSAVFENNTNLTASCSMIWEKGGKFISDKASCVPVATGEYTVTANLREIPDKGIKPAKAKTSVVVNQGNSAVKYTFPPKIYVGQSQLTAAFESNMPGKFVVNNKTYEAENSNNSYIAQIPLETGAAGDKAINYKFKPDNPNYCEMTGSAAYKVEKIPVTVAFQPIAKDYDGTATASDVTAPVYSTVSCLQLPVPKVNRHVFPLPSPNAGEYRIDGPQSSSFSNLPANKYEVTVEAVSVTVHPLKVSFQVDIGDKGFDGSADVHTIKKIKFMGRAAAPDGQRDFSLNLSATDLKYENAGDPDQDVPETVELKQPTKQPAVLVDGQPTQNYYTNAESISFTNAKILKNTASAQQYSLPDEHYTDSSQKNWYKGSSVKVTGKNGFQINPSSFWSNPLGWLNNFTQEAECVPDKNGEMSFYLRDTKNFFHPIFTAQLHHIWTDNTAPQIQLETVNHAKPSAKFDFGQTELCYTLKVSDAGSGTKRVIFCVADSENLPDSAVWKEAAYQNGEYTFTVKAEDASSGWLFIRADDNVGNVRLLEPRCFVLEKNAPVSSVTVDNEKYERIHTVALDIKDSAEDGQPPYPYSGLSQILYTLYHNNEPVPRFSSVPVYSAKEPDSMSDLPLNRVYHHSLTIDGAGLNGDYTLKVEALDFCGNKQESSIDLHFDGTPPTAAVILKNGRKADGQWYYNKSNCAVTVRFSDDRLADGGQYTATISDEKNVLSLDSSSMTKLSNTVGEISFSTDQVTKLRDGALTVTVSAQDSAGNVTTVLDSDSPAVLEGMKATFILDTVAPTITKISSTETPTKIYHDVGGASVYYKANAVDLTFTIAEQNAELLHAEMKKDGHAVDQGSDSKDTVSVSKNSITFHMQSEGHYTEFTVSGTDLAGNSVTVASQKVWDKECDAPAAKTGEIEIPCGKTIDRTPPVAKITYHSAAQTHWYPDENTAYYNQNIDVKITVTDTCGNSLETLDGAGLWTLQNGKKKLLATSAENYTVREDGKYSYSAYGCDRAGNPLTVQEFSPETNTAATTENCAESYTNRYWVVRDTQAPTFQLSILPEAGVSRSSLQSGRYYFNRGFTMSVEVNDSNFDSEKVIVERGSIAGVDYDSQTVQINSYNTRIDTASQNRYSDSIPSNADGVYRYRIHGEDKAGNEIVPNSEANLDNTSSQDGFHSNYVVVDTKVPSGIIAIRTADGTAPYYEMDTNGSVITAYPFRKEKKAKVTFSVNQAEHSPVKMSYVLATTEGTSSHKIKRQTVDSNFQYRNTVTFDITGAQVFSIDSFTISDLAGNTVSCGPTNTIYLDTAAPQVNKLAPTVRVEAKCRSNAHGRSGTPLFRSNVPIHIAVTEPYGYARSSGIGNVTYRLYMNGKIVSQDTRILHKSTVVPSAGKYQDPQLTYTIDTVVEVNAASHNSNDLRVVVTAADNSNNVASRSYQFGIDTTPPTIQVSYDNNSAQNGKYFKNNRRATITVTERNFDPSRIAIQTSSNASIGSWTYVRGRKPNGDDDQWNASIYYQHDGAYKLSVSGSDLLGHAAASAQYIGTAAQDFVLDKTPPEISVSYDTGAAENGKYFKTQRTATVRVADENFRGENNIHVNANAGGIAPAVSFNGKTAALLFHTDGTYSFAGTVTDLAGNVSRPLREREFVIDKTMPEVSVQGVKNLSANRKAVHITVKMKEKNSGLNGIQVQTFGSNLGKVTVPGARTFITGGVEYVLDPVETDDYYKMTVTGMDLAGNTVTKQISFSENHKGTVFEFLQSDIRGGYTNRAFQPAVTLHDVDNVTVLSVALNGESVPYQYKKSTVTLSNKLQMEGKYTLAIDTKDEAGNVNIMKPVEFIIDRTPPLLRIDGVQDGTFYFQSVKIELHKEDKTDSLCVLNLDGTNLTPKKYLNSANDTAVLNVSDFTQHILKVQLRDRAGNVSKLKVLHFMLTHNPILRWYQNKVLFFTAQGVAVAGCLAGFSYYFHRKKRGKGISEKHG